MTKKTIEMRYDCSRSSTVSSKDIAGIDMKSSSWMWNGTRKCDNANNNNNNNNNNKNNLTLNSITYYTRMNEQHHTTRSIFKLRRLRGTQAIPICLLLCVFLSSFQCIQRLGLVPIQILQVEAVDIMEDFGGYYDNHNFIDEKRKELVVFTKKNIIQPIKQQYNTLSPKGKFASTAFAGFATSRYTIGTTIKVAKYTGAAFIISEVMNSAGMLDNDNDNMLDNGMIHQVKSTITTGVKQCRLAIRKHCNMQKIKKKYDACLEKDRTGTLGFTTGAVVALIL